MGTDDSDHGSWRRGLEPVARAKLLDRLDQLLTGNGADRSVMVTGGTRADRRSLLAAWLAHREATGDAEPHLPIHAEDDGWVDSAELVDALVARLEQRFGRVGRDEGARAAPWERLEREPWGRLASALARVSASVLVPGGQRLVILIDGLDDHDPADLDLLAMSLARELPCGVSFLCSYESEAPFVDRLARLGKLVQIDLDLDEVLEAKLFVRSAALDFDPQVRRRHGSRASSDRFWARLLSRGQAGVGLGLLCAAREALPREALAELAEWGPEQEESFLREARVLLREEAAAWNGAAAYGLTPDGTRELIAEQIGAVALRTYHRWLWQRLATWPPLVGAAERRYTLRYALYHRIESGDWGDAWRLAANLGFLEARCRELGFDEVRLEMTRTAERCREHVDEALCRRFEGLAQALAREAPRLRAAPEAIAALVWNRLRRSGWSEDDLDAELRVPADATFLRLQHWAARGGSAPTGNAAGHARRVSACAATPDGGYVVSASYDRTLKVWDVESGAELVTLDEHAGWVNGCAVMPGGRGAISASEDGSLKVWDLERKRSLATQGGDGALRACAVTPDGQRVISASADGTLKVWDLERERLAMLKGHTVGVLACAVTPDGRRAVSGSYDRTLKLWDLDGGRLLVTLEGHTRGVLACAVTPDGRHVVSASADGTLRIWELDSGRARATLEGHAAEVHACAVSLDGRRVVSASADRTLKVWDLDTCACLFTHYGDTAFSAVAATATHVIAGDDAGAVWFLRWPPAMLAREIRKLVTSDWRDPAPVLRVVDGLAKDATTSLREVSLGEIQRVSSAPGLAESLKIAEYLASERIGLFVARFALVGDDGPTDLPDETVHLALRTGILRDPRTGAALDDWRRRVVLSYRIAATEHEEG